MSGNPDEAFLNACSMTGILRLVAGAGGGLPTEVWAGPRPFALIGRDANADLHLDHGTVSRRHVYLQAVEGRLFGMDLGSRTGTRLRGKPWQTGWLASGDVLDVGSYEVRIEECGTKRTGGFSTIEDARGPLSSRYRALEGLPGVSLEISVPARSPILWRMGRVMVLVGSSPDCKLRLVDQNVARFQCSLLRTLAGVWVVDLLGDGGIFVNGDFVRSARLEHGDRLQVGHALIRVRLDDSSPNGRVQFLRALGSSPTPQALTGILSPILSSSGMGTHLPMPMFPDGPAAPGDPGTQFAAFQQQMFDQFHQLMMGMIQAFGAMHREQMGAVRDDLDRLEQITQELQDLRSRPPIPPHKSSDAIKPAPSSPPVSPGHEPSRTADNPTEGVKADEIFPPAREQNEGRATQNGRNGTDAHLTSPASPELNPVEILRRIQELQRERQGHWQRIVGFLFGAP